MAEIEDWVAENYDSIAQDPNRSETYESIAENAEAHESPSLAAWARKRAAETGKNTTPVTAKRAGRSIR